MLRSVYNDLSFVGLRVGWQILCQHILSVLEAMRYCHVRVRPQALYIMIYVYIYLFYMYV